MSALGQLSPRQPGGIRRPPSPHARSKACHSVTPTKGSSRMQRKVKCTELGASDVRHSPARLLPHSHSTSLTMAGTEGRPLARSRSDTESQPASWTQNAKPGSCFLTQARHENSRPGRAAESWEGGAGRQGRALRMHGLQFLPLVPSSSFPLPKTLPEGRKGQLLGR